MDDILKYHRIQGKFREILKSEIITASTIFHNGIIIGTDKGFLHVLSFIGQAIKSFKPHDRSINSLSCDSSGTFITSCSDNGTVIIQSIGGEEDKESVIQLNQPLKVVCVENDGTLKKDRSILIGTANGQLIHHKTVWFTQKNIILFSGAGSAVSNISWRGDLVAWSDSTAVRVMNIATQTAICYLNSPLGVSLANPFPCSLFWEDPSNLYVGWADNFRHLEFLPSSANPNLLGLHSQSGHGGSGEDEEMGARIVSEWHTDCLICGISSFDVDNIVLLGYIPPDEQELEEFNRQQLDWQKEKEKEREKDKGKFGASSNTESIFQSFPLTNRPELQILNKSTGDLVCSDVLPLVGKEILDGPQAFTLLSSFASPVRGKDASKWQLSSLYEARGGTRGLSPSLFVLAPQDLVGSRVRDVNDRIASALQRADLSQAAYLAISHKSSLRNYHYQDLVSLYVEDLLDRGQPDLAGKELAQLTGTDSVEWEKWVFAFSQRKVLSSICFHIPTDKPRLSSAVYEVVLETFLQSNSKLFSEIFFKWSKYDPPLFSHRSLLTRLESLRKTDLFFLQVQAQLYILCGLSEQALNCYLEISYPEGEDPSNPGHVHGGVEAANRDSILKGHAFSGGVESGRDSTPVGPDPYRQVFELIEKEKLFSVIRDKIKNLLRLSRDLTSHLLVKYVDHLPILYVARQLRSDRFLLHWYLHTMLCFCESYSQDADYSELHSLQVTLYAEFAFSQPQFQSHLQLPEYQKQSQQQQQHKQQQPTNSLSTHSPTQTSSSASSAPSWDTDTDFLYFLRKSKFYSVDFALRECERARPPLYREMVYLLDVKGMVVDALSLLLREIPNPMSPALSFIASHDRSVQPSLWRVLVDHTLVRYDERERDEREMRTLIRRDKHSEGGEEVGQLLDYLAQGEGEGEGEGEAGEESHSLTNQNKHRAGSGGGGGGTAARGGSGLGPGSGSGDIGLEVISRIPPSTQIPHLRGRMQDILKKGHYQLFVNEKCNRLLESDALDSLRRLNQTQRRAQKVDPNLRCCVCARPLFLPAGSPLISLSGGKDGAKDGSSSSSSSSTSLSQLKVWGGGGLGGGSGGGGGALGSSLKSSGVVIFSNKQCFHRICFDRSQFGQ